MKQVIKDFKSIMADSRERNEFIGSFASALVFLFIVFMTVMIFGK